MRIITFSILKQAVSNSYIFFFKQQTLHDGSVLDLPPVMFGKLGNDPAKKTVMLYGHLDVQPALKVNVITAISVGFND